MSIVGWVKEKFFNMLSRLIVVVAENKKHKGSLTLSSSYHREYFSPSCPMRIKYKNALNDIGQCTHAVTYVRLNWLSLSSNIDMFFTFFLSHRASVIDGRLSLIKLICAIHSSIRRNCVNRYCHVSMTMLILCYCFFFESELMMTFEFSCDFLEREKLFSSA